MCKLTKHLQEFTKLNVGALVANFCYLILKEMPMWKEFIEKYMKNYNICLHTNKKLIFVEQKYQFSNQIS